ncbi:MAG TPA: lauroyl acyltransferase [Aliiroseovarius sp.]|nr:lauroyl acyltransferase [Aliiroseovarius sp.]
MERKGIGAWLTNLVFVVVLNAPKILPYRWRIPAIGWITAHVLSPLAGYETRSRQNLTLVCPELSPKQITDISRQAANNAGRMFAEMYSQKGFDKRVADTTLSGPGVAALEQARLAGTPIIAVSGHLGNYNASRVVLSQAGHKIGGLYRPMRNVYFNAHYARNMEAVSKPVFEQSRRGLAQMIKHLRAGHMIALLTDQRDPDGAWLTFFGQPVLTPLSAAELALKYGALLVPVYGIRRENGLDFDVRVCPPIAHSDARTMTQQVNDSLEQQVRAHMGQYLWAHRRWYVPQDNPPPPGLGA